MRIIYITFPYSLLSPELTLLLARISEEYYVCDTNTENVAMWNALPLCIIISPFCVLVTVGSFSVYMRSLALCTHNTQ